MSIDDTSPCGRIRVRILGLVPATAAAGAAVTAVASVVGTSNPIGHPLGALAFPVAAGLLILSGRLARGYRRASELASVLLGTLAAAKILDGGSLFIAALALAVASLLLTSRRAFPVRSAMPSFSLPTRGTLLVAGLVGAAVAVSWRFLPWAPTVASSGRGLLAGTGPDAVTAAIALAGVAVMTALVTTALRAEAPRRERRLRTDAVQSILHTHGSDTLAAFKQRSDLEYFFNDEATAFAGYRIEGGTLLLAGDPVGEPSALGSLLEQIAAFAELHGLRFGAVAAGTGLLPAYRALGLHALYIGDEAVVDTNGFSLEGRAIRKVRQSVTRLRRAGYTVEVTPTSAIDAETARSLSAVSAAWRGGAPERGFSMALDTITGAAAGQATLVIARDETGRPRAFLQFLPTFRRRAMSLAAMRREPGAPNGLSEFLIVSAFEAFRRQGIEEVSLNFAAFGRVFRAPNSTLDRLFARVLRLGGRFFQIESLYRFNAKFDPRWEPRFLIYEGALALPRIGLACLSVEGQLPRLLAARRSGRARRPLGTIPT